MEILVDKYIQNLIYLTFFLYEMFFLWRGIKNSKDYKQKGLMEKEAEVLDHLICGPWKTPYFIGGPIQLILLFVTIFSQLPY